MSPHTVIPPIPLVAAIFAMIFTIAKINERVRFAVMFFSTITYVISLSLFFAAESRSVGYGETCVLVGVGATFVFWTFLVGEGILKTGGRMAKAG